MRFSQKGFLFFLIPFFIFFTASFTNAQVKWTDYGLQPVKNLLSENQVNHAMDSLINANIYLTSKTPKYENAQPRNFVNRAADFYFLLGLVLFLGIIRILNPKYFTELSHAFFNSGESGRATKEKLQTTTLSSTLMNLFFIIAFAAYIFYVLRNFAAVRLWERLPATMLFFITGGILIIYLMKFLVIKFSGWAFHLKSVTDHYLFNVFLVNKMLGIILLPFIVLLAFPSSRLLFPVLVFSVVLVITSVVMRYLRSWKMLGSFFHYSKFHFFTYLCASEILPLAVLMKFLWNQFLKV